MKTISRFFNDLAKYREYIISSIQAELTTQYSFSVIGYLWWILDPFLYMFIYVFIVSFVFGRGGPNYPVFLFTGLLFWRWASSTFQRSVNSILTKRSILTQIYLPKFLLPLVRVLVETVYFLFSLLVLFALLLFYKIPITWHFIEVIPIIIVQFLFIFGVGLWLAHLGVYYYDIDRLLTFFLRIWYYFSPGIFALDTIPQPYRYLFWINPLTTIMTSSRAVFLDGNSPNYLALSILGLVSLVLIYFGLKTSYKFDRTYTKVF